MNDLTTTYTKDTMGYLYINDHQPLYGSISGCLKKEALWII
jgi:hypothetical protein